MKDDVSFRDFYDSLPRFVSAGEVEYEFGKYLSPIERRVEWEKVEFGLVISPALITDPAGGDKCYFPGKTEQIVEAALIAMADPKNPDFYEKESALVVRLDYLLDVVSEVSGNLDVSLSDVELALHVLSDAGYTLIRDDAELSFYSIERLSRAERNGEVYYYAKLTGISSGMGKIFKYLFGESELSDLVESV